MDSKESRWIREVEGRDVHARLRVNLSRRNATRRDASTQLARNASLFLFSSPPLPFQTFFHQDSNLQVRERWPQDSHRPCGSQPLSSAEATRRCHRMDGGAGPKGRKLETWRTKEGTAEGKMKPRRKVRGGLAGGGEGRTTEVKKMCPESSMRPRRRSER